MAREHFITCDVVGDDGTPCTSREKIAHPLALPKGWAQVQLAREPAPRPVIPLGRMGGFRGLAGVPGVMPGMQPNPRLRQLLRDPMEFFRDAFTRLQGTITEAHEDRHMKTILTFIDEIFAPATPIPPVGTPTRPPGQRPDLAQDMAQPADVPFDFPEGSGSVAADDEASAPIAGDAIDEDDESIAAAYGMFVEPIEQVFGTCCPLHAVPNIKPVPMPLGYGIAHPVGLDYGWCGG